MLAELMVAGRGIATAAGAFGSTVSNRHSSHGTHNGGQAAGAAFTGGGNGLVGVTKRAVGNAAASSATGTGSGLSNIIGGAMFGSSLPLLLMEPASAWPWQKWSKRSWLSAVSVIVGAVLQ